MISFLSQLSQSTPLILDGATGTELDRRGVDIGLPLWSANALLADSAADVLRQVHLDYLNAGADIITANTFRAHRRALAKSAYHDQARELTQRAVAVAKEAVGRREAGKSSYIAGSIAPLEDCYQPQLVPPEAECRAEHSERVHHLVEAGVDLLLIETMNTIREAAIAARLAVITGLPTIVSFVCGADGRLLSGESLTAAAQVMTPLGVAAVGVNCTATPVIADCLKELRSATDLPLIAYGNIGYADADGNWVCTDAIEPDAYANYAREWKANIIGGCCGTTPEHIRRIANAS
ncbi:MAG: homocysteine S-methyltransferase family protein [Chloroflexi bacterium]|nr:homocysteine S-methyltransferase family protein [Chloroflexota bacterium]